MEGWYHPSIARMTPNREGHMASHIARRKFLATLGGAAAWPLAARAQQPERVRRIGILETTSRPLNAANFEALREGLRELGHIEGRNLVIEYRSADGRPERFPRTGNGASPFELRSDHDARDAGGAGGQTSKRDDTGTLPEGRAARVTS
jgi:putative ABC transport system substrate-binding protein